MALNSQSADIGIADIGQAAIAHTVEISSEPATDPLAWLSSASDTDEAWFWELPNDQESWIGLGSAATFNVSGPHRFKDADDASAQLWSSLQLQSPPDAPLPRLAAGFAFEDDIQDGSPLWSPFGTGRIVLPAVQILRRQGRTWLTRIDGHHRPAPGIGAPRPVEPVVVEPARMASDFEKDHYRTLVRLALKSIERGDLTKAVPCRALSVNCQPDPMVLLATLRSLYPACATFAIRPASNSDFRGTATFVGATPECLAAVRLGHLHTAALAGSAPRDPDPAIDAALGQGLLTSPKERKEHAVVVDAVHQALADLGLADQHPRRPSLLRLHGIQHLHTPIDADLSDQVGLLDLVGALHPTPAVAGHPKGQAAELRATHEGIDRGWFAGPVGWMEASGDGEFRVALRSGLITDSETVFYAGAGVVAGSDADRELLETDVKLHALLGAAMASSNYRL